MINYEAKSEYAIEVEVDDGEGTTKKTIIVKVNNKNDVPVLTVKDMEIEENSASGTVVGSVKGTDEDTDAKLTFKLDGQPSWFTIDHSGVIRVKDGAKIDYEQVESAKYAVTLTDGKYTIVDTITISIKNIVEVSEIDLVKVSDKDSTWMAPDTVWVSANELTAVWNKAGKNDTKKYDISDSNGVAVFIESFQDPTADLPGTDKFIAVINRKDPNVKIKTKDLNIVDSILYTNNPGQTIDVVIDYIDSKLKKATLDSTVNLKGLKEGENEIIVKYVDIYGNVGYDTLKVVFDTTAPVVVINDPKTDDIFESLTADVEWTVNDDIQDTLTRQVLYLGKNRIIRSFTDLAGNKGSDTVIVTVKFRDPNVKIKVENALVEEDKLIPAEEYYDKKGRDVPNDESYALTVLNHFYGVEEEMQYKADGKVVEVDRRDRIGWETGSHRGVTIEADLRFPMNGGINGDGDGRPGTCEDGEPMWKLVMEDVKLEVYDNIGQFVTDMYIPATEFDKPEYQNDKGEVKIFFELSPETFNGKSSMITRSGRVWGTGSYVIRAFVATSATPVNCNDQGSLIRNNRVILTTVGYRRN